IERPGVADVRAVAPRLFVDDAVRAVAGDEAGGRVGGLGLPARGECDARRGCVERPSACPRATRSSPGAASAYSENLRLDDPALRPAIASATSPGSSRRSALARGRRAATR